MILKKNYIKIWIHIIGILLTCLAIAFVSIPKPDWFYIINLLILLFIQVFLFVRSQNILNRDLAYLFDSIESTETSISFTKKKGKTNLNNIYEKFDSLLKHVQELRVDSLQKNVYLTTLFEHINIGILTIDQNGNISLKNSWARKLLGRGNINTLDDIRDIDNSFANTLEKIRPAESRLISFYKDDFLQHLLIRATLLKFPTEEVKIVSFQNIRGELDEREMEGWQKLIKVLTHELMNSVGPINSTISTIMDLLTENKQAPKKIEKINTDDLNDAIKGIKIIEERSKGMLDFVKRFRSLTLVPQPVFDEIEINHLINNIIALMKDEAIKNGVKIENRTLFKNLYVNADKAMIEQIILNLIKNSFEALSNTSNPTIHISASSDNGQNVFINIFDNGKGIPLHIQEKIFVPFYTSYKHGTGIGLSLSRQLANAQGGSLVLSKSTRNETVFTLTLKMFHDKTQV